METKQTTGLILESRPYQEGNAIVSLFSPELGMVRLFAPRRKNLRTPPTPLTEVECLYASKGEDTLFRLRELSVRNPYLTLRESFQALQLAGFLAHSLLQSQLLWKPAPALYQLLCAYLRYAHKTKNPSGYVGSFLLKLLTHEGLLGLSARCAQCSASLYRAALVPGETLCPAHAPDWSIVFEHEQLIHLSALVSIQNLAQLEPLATSSTFEAKIRTLFGQLTS